MFLEAKNLIAARGSQPVELSKIFSETRMTAKIAAKLGYTKLDNPGNTRILNNSGIRSQERKRMKEFSRAKIDFIKDSEEALRVATQIAEINGTKVKVRKITRPKEEDYKISEEFKKVNSRLNIVGQRPWSARQRADEMSWRVSSLGNMRVQIYLNPNFTGDTINEAILLIARLNAYVIARRNGEQIERDSVFERYIHPPKVRHPKYDKLESAGWPAVVWAKDLHTPTAEYHGYSLHRNPSRKDGRWMAYKFKILYTKDSPEHGVENYSAEAGRFLPVYVQKEKLTSTSIIDFLKGEKNV